MNDNSDFYRQMQALKSYPWNRTITENGIWQWIPFGYERISEFNYRKIVEEKYKNMTNFQKGEQVRLKNSPYEGEVISCGITSITFRDSKTGVTVGVDLNAIERVISPQLGDIYLDKDGREWIARTDFANSFSTYIILQCIDDRKAPLYYFNTAPATENNLDDWISRYQPKLIRRRA